MRSHCTPIRSRTSSWRGCGGAASPSRSASSNRQILGVDPVGHPLVDYLAAGVPVVLATDDPGLMLSDLRQQFALAARNDAVSYRTLKTFAIDSITYSFLPGADRQRLLRRLEEDFAAFETTIWGTGGH